MSARQGAGGLVVRSARRQPWGWPALLFSMGLHGALIAAAMWISFGSQGDQGVEGESLVDADAASVPIPVLRTTQPQEATFKITPKPVRALRTANLPRLVAKTEKADVVLAKSELPPMKPILAQPLAPAPQAIAKPAPAPQPTIAKAIPTTKPASQAVEKPGQGEGSTTQRKASGQGSKPSSGGAGNMAWTSRIVSSFPPTRPRQAELDPSIRGTTRVQVKIKPDGHVASCSIWESSGFEVLDAAALRCVRKWVFTPPQKSDDAVIVWLKF